MRRETCSSPASACTKWDPPGVASFCTAFFNTTDRIIVVEDTTKDAGFSAHPFVTGPPFVRFYVGARLQVRGETVGTLCAYDLEPSRVDEAQLANLQVLASAVVELLINRVRKLDGGKTGGLQ